MPHIIAIEDETDLRMVLKYNLEQAGYSVIVTGSGLDGLRLAREQHPDLVLLDLMLPDISGTQVCRKLKSHSETRATPVVMVTARGSEIDRVVGFEVGADDYVVKPFSMRELMLRISAILRRHQPERLSEGPQTIVEFGRLRIDRGAHRAWVDGAKVELTALEFRLLETLYDRKGRVQTRAELLHNVWGIQSDPATRTVDTHVKRLREKLDRASDYVKTVRGVGYRFVSSQQEATS